MTSEGIEKAVIKVW